MARTGGDPELLVWDFDGTLADTRRVILGSFSQVFAERDLGDLDATTVAASIGLPLSQVFSRITGVSNPDEVAALVAHYREVFAVRVLTEATLFDGVALLLEQIGHIGRPCAITTSRGRASLEAMLEQFGIADRFAAVVCDDDVTNPKPHPEMVLRVADSVGVPTARTLVIGDTTFDLAMGRSAGAVTCGVTWGNQTATELAAASPDHLVDRVDQLGDLVGTGTAPPRGGSPTPGATTGIPSGRAAPHVAPSSPST